MLFQNPLRLFFLITLVLLQMMSSSDAFHFEIENATFITSQASSNDYFGYQILIDNLSATNSGIVSIVLGAPKTRQPTDEYVAQAQTLKNDSMEMTGSGGLHLCSVDLLSSDQNCSSILPPKPDPATNPDLITDRDSIGFALSRQENTDNLTVCAPFRTWNCPKSYLTYGACYMSADFGSTWDPNSRNVLPDCGSDLDLIFLLDGSGSISLDQFRQVLNWTVAVASRFNIEGATKIGVVQFSHFFVNDTNVANPSEFLETEIAIGQFTDFDDFSQAVHAIVRHGYTTFTAHAINKTVEDFMTSPRFNDPETRKVLVLLTDGKASDPEYLEASSNYARSLGIVIYAVGVANAMENELKIITGNFANVSENDNVFNLGSFDDLTQIVSSLQEAITASLEGGSANTNLTSNVTNKLTQSETGISASYTTVSYNLLLYACNVLACVCIACVCVCVCVFVARSLRKKHEIRIACLEITKFDEFVMSIAMTM
ncbi:integrin alpha-X-like [Clavelina lepadiformis]|uniref:VWFA domain-containing protein n=1 Tax=Clavelina lepadiformis TaxID=159417 RepID=A0ABP0FCT7_CLALP